jgi:N-hydroxyarylamine O-acetyltransferase
VESAPPYEATVDLAAYFARIGYDGPRTPTLGTLNELVLRHVQRIPFENLDVLLQRPISTKLEDIEAKLVNAERGGYCFEQNTLFLHVLEALGFEVSALSARSRWQRAHRYEVPRTHVLLQAKLREGTYLVDVGFGGLSPTCALPLELDVEQATPHEPRRLIREGVWHGLHAREPDAVLVQQASLDGSWQDLYELTLEHMPLVDRDMGNWYTSAHPRSHFRDSLMAARATAEGRVTLRDRELTIRGRDGSSRAVTLATHAELLSALDEHFGLRLPPDTRFACTAWAGRE